MKHRGGYNLPEALARFKELPKEDFDTRNGWGFGGDKGSRWILPDGYVIRVGQTFYRHNPPTTFTQLVNPEGLTLAIGTRSVNETLKEMKL